MITSVELWAGPKDGDESPVSPQALIPAFLFLCPDCVEPSQSMCERCPSREDHARLVYEFEGLVNKSTARYRYAGERV